MMLRVFLLLAFCFSTAWGQGVPYRNRGIAINKQIAANSVIDGILVNDIFINDGLFEVQNYAAVTNLNSNGNISFTPYDMEGMRRYTNNGVFIGMSARFDTVNEFGYRVPATTFVNTENGRMDFLDGVIIGDGLTQLDLLFPEGYVTPLAHVNVNAVNIENHGLLRIGAGGVAMLGGTNSVTGELTADSVNLKGGTLLTDDIGNVMGNAGLFDDTLLVNNQGIGIGYLNPVAIYDLYWGAGTFTNQSVVGFMTVNPTQVITPLHRITNSTGPLGQTILFLTNAQSWGYVTQTSPTNINIQTVFVQTGNTNVTADVRWTTLFRGVDDNASGFLSAVVKLSSTTQDPFTQLSTVKQLFIWDQLGLASNRTVIPNDKYVGGFRPLNYFVNRLDPIGFDFFNTISNTVVTPDLFYGPNFVSPVATNFYAAYSFNVVNLIYNPPVLNFVTNTFEPPTGVYDLPGRFEIRGKKLDLTHTAIRSEGLVSLNSPNIVQPDETLIDAQNLTFNFTYTNTVTPFRFKGLAKKAISRLGGDVRMWSGVWTNLFRDIQPGPGGTLVTNFISLQYHSLVVDASALSQTQAVNVADFNVQTASLLIQDNMAVSNRFNTTARDLTVEASVELLNVPFTQDSQNLANLRNLTVESTGELRLYGLADFGAFDRNLSNFVNRGTISSYSHSIIADNVDITGMMISGQPGFVPVTTPIGILLTNAFVTNSGPFYITANRSGRLTGANLATYGDVTFTGKVFKFTDTTVNAGATINLNVTDSLQDAGVTADNLFVSSNSFSMLTVPSVGNLLGSTFEAQPPPRGIFRILWGTPTNTITSITNIPTTGTWPTLTNLAAIAYSTNTAIGRLKLDSDVSTVFEFSGTKRGSALFVDTIEITGGGIANFASLTNQIRLITNSTTSIDIYYANIVATNLQKGLSLGFTNLAEFFNGRKFPGGGTFHWVPNFNGPISAEDVVQTVVANGATNQVTIQMNRALRRSLIIDMDGDGIANGNDDFPLNNAPGPVTIASIRLSAVDGHINVQFTAFPGVYQVQAADSLEGTVTWKTVSSYQHPGPLATVMTLADPDPVSLGTRFYRLIYTR
jgi:hypothetical protein